MLLLCCYHCLTVDECLVGPNMLSVKMMCGLVDTIPTVVFLNVFHRTPTQTVCWLFSLELKSHRPIQQLMRVIAGRVETFSTWRRCYAAGVQWFSV